MGETENYERYFCNVLGHNKEPRLLMCPKCKTEEVAKAKLEGKRELLDDILFMKDGKYKIDTSKILRLKEELHKRGGQSE